MGFMEILAYTILGIMVLVIGLNMLDKKGTIDEKTLAEDVEKEKMKPKSDLESIATGVGIFYLFTKLKK